MPNGEPCDRHDEIVATINTLQKQAQRNSDELIRGDGRFNLFKQQLDQINETLQDIQKSLKKARPLVTTKAATIIATAITAGFSAVAGAILRVWG